MTIPSRSPRHLAAAVRIVREVENWPAYAADYLGMTHDPFVLRLRSGIRLAMRTGKTDLGIFNEIWAHRHYTPQGFEIGPADCVMDVGAHIGLFTLYAASQAPQGRIVAFEPVPENFALLRENVERNEASHVTAVRPSTGRPDGRERDDPVT